MSAQNIVFEFGHRDDMAMRLALSNTAESIMSALGPFTGGLIATAFGYHAVFGTSIGFEVIALVLLLTLVEEPRKRRLALEAEKMEALAETEHDELGAAGSGRVKGGGLLLPGAPEPRLSNRS